MKPHYYHHKAVFPLEAGDLLPELTIAYHTWGQLNETGDNVIWICHALTANSDAEDWWKGMIGAGCVFDPGQYFIVCANILGSSYGTTGPTSMDPRTGKPYYHHFPLLTIRDMVAAHELLRQHLGIREIFLLAGGSMGGYQVLEWTAMHPTVIRRQFLIVTTARETAWGIAIHTAQRLAIEADPGWKTNAPGAGEKGLAAARAIGMLTYRNYASFVSTQTDEDLEKLDDFKASSYIKHQGDKLTKRFNAYAYWTLTKALDTHNLARGRAKTVGGVLRQMQQSTLVIGIKGDVLVPVEELQYLSRHLPHARYQEIDSLFGHDGFLVETAAISAHIRDWLVPEPQATRS
ncbi:MAG: homoserine O-acetyltransferase family protein [Flavisolibacter sp.]